ncbi:sugar ABC transporter permease [Brucella cytisi]|uniref:Sugar ABC transporter permease n=2 Tax=Brucella cytisi TaxID=407152 RepID=A0A1J6IER7_9HYPH|nr:sugar ABC transporter permease [Brucella cytisi]OIS93576.1 sugar ABC transporter permease [Brucella cytisi]
MAGKHMRLAGRLALAPSIVVLIIGMVVPLLMTFWFSFQFYNLMNPSLGGFAGLENYTYFVTDPAFGQAIKNTLLLVVGVLAATVIGGIFLALLFDQPMWGQGIVRLLVIAPFFVMPTVAALVWKNMFMHPGYGLFAWIALKLGFTPIDWLGEYPLFSVGIIATWEWLPFATLIFLTALQSLDGEQKEAARMDGAGALSRFRYLTLPHLSRAIAVVILMETIFILSIFAEIFVTTGGGPGTASTNLPFLIYVQALLQFDVGAASAGGIIAVILANMVAIFSLRSAGKNLTA